MSDTNNPRCPHCFKEAVWDLQDGYESHGYRFTVRALVCSYNCGWYGGDAWFPWRGNPSMPEMRSHLPAHPGDDTEPMLDPFADTEPMLAPEEGAPPLDYRVTPPGKIDFWREEAEGFEARLNDVLAALDEAGVDPGDKLEEGDAVRALAAERDQLRDLVTTIREELGLLEVHDDGEVLRELAELKALRAVLAGVKAFEVDYHDVVARAEAAEDALAAVRGGYVGGALS